MALEKRAVPINFSQGLDTKSDPYQVPFGKFLSLQNSIFTKEGLLQKRNGYKALPSLPLTAKFATTFNGNLTAIGTSLQALSPGTDTWVNKGQLHPASLDVLPLVRSNNNQSQTDTAFSNNGLVCTVYTDVGASTTYKYVIANADTGQNIVPPTALVASASFGTPRVFALGNYFIIVYTQLVSATNHLQYISINFYSLTRSAPVDISTTYTPATTVAFDGVVANNNLYISWNGSDGGGAIHTTFLTSTLTLGSTKTIATNAGTIFSLCADTSGTTVNIYVLWYNLGTTTAKVAVYSAALSVVLAATTLFTSGTVLNLTSVATAGVCTFYYELSNNYTYDSAVPSHFVNKNTVTVAGTVGTAANLLRSVGLASKSFIYSGVIYVLVTYSSSYQPTYFLINGSSQVVAKFSYSNGGGYLTLGLPSVTLNTSDVEVSYLTKDLIQATNKTQGAASSLPVSSQTGINLITIDLNPDTISTAEIGNNLLISGGFLWSYDGYTPVEQNFFVWPDNIEAAWSATGGSIHAQPDGSTNTDAYAYQVVYEWADNQANVQRSAPSIPIFVTTTASGTAGSIVIQGPNARITYKTTTPINIVLYRWSVANQSYYKVGSVVNSTTADSFTFTDTLADASIIGNALIYTTGGVVEDISPPATKAITLYKARAILLDAEDPNTWYYSKQVIENTPVEMSDLFTQYNAPTIAAQGSTGDTECLSAMDDKLIFFKKDAIYYVIGEGPNNTGANNDFSDPVFVSSTVGCANQSSIVFTPNGLIFQSDKGMWLLGRDLSTSYIGAPVEAYNSFLVTSALAVPGTNQVRFGLSNGITLMYDYYYGQWGSFSNVAGVSATLYQGMHTFINANGTAYQENPGSYLDGALPVLMSWQTGWFNLAGLQGYQRLYNFYLLGTYYTPHKLTIGVSYDYSPYPAQFIYIKPNNYNGPYGSDPVYGASTPYGGTPVLDQWKVDVDQMRCQAFQLSMNESFDSFFQTIAGQGLTLSGINTVVGLKKGYVPLPASITTS